MPWATPSLSSVEAVLWSRNCWWGIHVAIGAGLVRGDGRDSALRRATENLERAVMAEPMQSF